MNQIQFITHHNDRFSYADSARLALEGGCRWIQLRMKEASDEEFLQTAAIVQPLCRQYRATFLLDDRVELAQRIHADGIHLGKSDMPVSEARRILGKGFIIGGTANTFEDVEHLWQEGADYIGCGPFRFTTTKQRLSPILGVEGYREIVRRMNERGIRLPIVAIGGILKEDIPTLLQTGVSGIALSGAILNADDPVQEMHDIIKLLQ